MLKRITAIAAVVLILYSIIGFSAVSAKVTDKNSALMSNAPKIFHANGFIYVQTSAEAPPFHQLQNQMEFGFNTASETHRQFTAEYDEASRYGPSLHILNLYLTYDMENLSDGQPFISGTFTYSWDHSGELKNYSGTVSGSLVEIDLEIMGFVSDYPYTNALALDLTVTQEPWDWIIYLEVPGEEDYYLGSTIIEDYTDEENTTGIPEPASQAEVAAGVGISTAGIAAANALTKTSVLGAVQSGAANAVPVSSAPTAAPAGNSGGVMASIKNFFKELFINLRDLLTDEGRSFASGKAADFLEDSDFDNSGDTE